MGTTGGQTARRAGLWARWAWRDFRDRAGLIVTISCVLAFGVGLSATFQSIADWMLRSYDTSYAVSAMHDVRVRLGTGSFVTASTLRDLVRSAGGGDVTAVEERLVVPTQIAVPAGAGRPATLVPATLVGVDTADGGPHVDRLHAAAGRVLDATDADTDHLMVAHDYARSHGLLPGTRTRIAGDHSVTVVGTGTNPSYFLGTSGDSQVFVSFEQAVVYASLETARSVSDVGNVSNEVVIRLRPGTDTVRFRRDLSSTLSARLPQVSATIVLASEEAGRRMLYADLTQDRQIYGLIAWLVLLGAGIAAFNLATRVVAAQRREIGVGMALGVPPWRLAVRPLLLAVELAVLGTILGIAVSWGFTAVLRPVMANLLTLPAWRTPLIWSQFVAAAAIGLTLPFVAVVWPVWRAVRRSPAEVARTGVHEGAGAPARLVAAAVERIPWPRTALGRMPLRDLSRGLRRTLLTALGIAATITVIVGMYGIIDSWSEAMRRVGADARNATPARVLVSLNRFVPDQSGIVRAVARNRSVDVAEPIAVIAATARPQGRTDAARALGLAITLAEPDGLWTPDVVTGTAHGDGIVLTRSAAANLGVGVGDTISLEHLFRTGTTTFDTRTTDVRVMGLTDNPMRGAAMMQRSMSSGRFGLDRWTNVVEVRPAANLGAETVAQALFGVAGVVAVEPADALAAAFTETIANYLGVFDVGVAAMILLAFGLAYNSARLGVEERRRDHATMFAFGVPVWQVERDLVLESCAVGLIGTTLGVVGGIAFLGYVAVVAMPAIMPELLMPITLTARTLGLAFVLGVGAVAVAPLLSWRRLRRVDITRELRVIE